MIKVIVFSLLFCFAVSYISDHSGDFIPPAPAVSSKPVSSAVSTDNSDVDFMLMTMPAVIATM
jgi:hypothetical protein